MNNDYSTLVSSLLKEEKIEKPKEPEIIEIKEETNSDVIIIEGVNESPIEALNWDGGKEHSVEVEEILVSDDNDERTIIMVGEKEEKTTVNEIVFEEENVVNKAGIVNCNEQGSYEGDLSEEVVLIVEKKYYVPENETKEPIKTATDVTSESGNENSSSSEDYVCIETYTANSETKSTEESNKPETEKYGQNKDDHTSFEYIYQVEEEHVSRLNETKDAINAVEQEILRQQEMAKKQEQLVKQEEEKNEEEKIEEEPNQQKELEKLLTSVMDNDTIEIYKKIFELPEDLSPILESTAIENVSEIFSDTMVKSGVVSMVNYRSIYDALCKSITVSGINLVESDIVLEESYLNEDLGVYMSETKNNYYFRIIPETLEPSRSNYLKFQAELLFKRVKECINSMSEKIEYSIVYGDTEIPIFTEKELSLIIKTLEKFFNVSKNNNMLVFNVKK